MRLAWLRQALHFLTPRGPTPRGPTPHGPTLHCLVLRGLVLHGLVLHGLALAGLLLPLASQAQRAPDPVPVKPPSTGITARDQEIASCRPGEWTTWGDGRDRPAVSRPLRFIYRHDGAPPWFDSGHVLDLARRAVQAWAGCGVPATVQPLPKGEVPSDEVIQILWSDTSSRGQFGLANVPVRTLSLGPALFRLLRERNPMYPADQTLQMVLSHEMGHFYGMMAHSRRCVDVMSYYDDGKGQRCTLRDPSAWGSVVEYRSTLPTACDIERCRALNAGASRRP